MRQYTGQSLPFSTHEENAPLSETIYRLTSVLLILSVLGFFIPFTILLAILHFTDQPASIAFPLFRQQSVVILLSYYVIALSGLLLIFAVLLLHQVLVRREVLTLTIATVCGVLGGLMQAIGDLRWPFLLPSLATAYFDPNSNQASRATVITIFQTVDQFAGIELSEHLYYLFIGVWSLLVGWYLLRSLRSLRSARWLAWLGIISGCGLLISSIEQFDWPVIGSALLVVVLLSRILWGIWLLAVAVVLLGRRTSASSIAPIQQR
ncbi:MAG: hypothetical protein NVS4B1_20080 [Ktedonobacteraceae bacterium]